MMTKNHKETTLADKSLSRREFLERLTVMGAGSLAAAIGGGLTETLTGANLSAAEKRKFRYGMVIDTRRCVGCRGCVVACKAENKTPPGVSYTTVYEEAIAANPYDKPVFMTRPCFHCENPPCVPVCPVNATFKRQQDGIVVMDYDRCLGLRLCIDACPYGVRYFDAGENYPAIAEKTSYANVPSPEYTQFRVREQNQPPIGKVRKCTFCMHLQDKNGRYDKGRGRWPACTKTCPSRAIMFGDFNDPQSEVSHLLRERAPVRLKEELGTQPNVYYLL